MDHLATFKTATGPYPKVPYLCTEPYDGESFQEYPTRMKWSHSQLLQGDFIQGHEPTEAAAFLQSWLYFGTLNELSVTGGSSLALITGGKVDLKKWVKEEEDGSKTVTSANLDKFVKKWADSLKDTRKGKQEEYLHHVTTALDSVCGFSEAFYQLHMKGDGKCPVPLEIILSLKLLGSSIDNALKDKELAQSIRVWGLASVATSRMREQKWCARDIAVASQFLSESSLYTASFIQRNVVDQDHSRCTATQCAFNQIDEATFKTKHREPDCQCESWAVEMAKVQQIIKDGSIPWIDIKPAKTEDGTKTLHIEVGARKDTIWSRPGLHFTIFSHVWSDGLGNPHQNALPMCQLAFFYDLLRNSPWTEVGAKANRDRQSGDKYKNKPMKDVIGFPPKKIRAPVREFLGKSVRIWIDTLCIPLDDETRKIAISNLKRYYSTASMTVVLDAELMRLNHKDGPQEELLTQVALSKWMRRCWTYQEGIIASGRMRVLFADGFYDLPEAVSFFRQMNSIAPIMQTDAWKGKMEKANLYGTIGGTAVIAAFTTFMVVKIVSDPAGAIGDWMTGDLKIGNGSTSRKIGSKVGNMFSTEKDPFAVLTASARFSAEAKSAFMAISAMWAGQPNPDSPEYVRDRLGRMVAAWEGLHYRTTTRASDRFINFMFACSKTEQDFKALNQILVMPSKDRFQAWVSEQPALPSGFLFVDGPKMDTPGFRWCPKDVHPTAIDGLDPFQIVQKPPTKEESQDDRNRFQRMFESSKNKLSSKKENPKEGQNSTTRASLQMTKVGSLEIQKPGFIIDKLTMKGDELYFTEQDSSTYYNMTLEWHSAPEDAAKDDEGQNCVFGVILSGEVNTDVKIATPIVGALIRDVAGAADVCAGSFVCRVLVKVVAQSKGHEYLLARRDGESQHWVVS